VVLGSALFVAAVSTAFILPVHNNSDNNAHNTGGSFGYLNYIVTLLRFYIQYTIRYNSGMMKVLKIPGVMIASMSIIATSMSIGFLQATLEPHLRQFNLSPVVLGLMFVINGGTYAITAPAWGWFCDNHWHPKVIPYCKYRKKISTILYIEFQLSITLSP